MPRHGQLTSDDEIEAGGSEAFKGAVHGATLVGRPRFLCSFPVAANHHSSGAFRFLLVDLLRTARGRSIVT